MASRAAPWLSVEVPVLNDAPALGRLLAELVPLTAAEPPLEVVVVDGGSREPPVAKQVAGIRVVLSEEPGRGRQLRVGTEAADGEWLWLLHADSSGLGAALAYLSALRQPAWGRFDVALAGSSLPMAWGLKTVAWLMSWRSRLTGICTGDQGIFVHRDLLEQAGGVPAQPLMEDIELSRRLKRISQPLCPRLRIITSSRRWAARGLIRTVLSMWYFRLRYWLGADPKQLAREYYREP